MTWRVQHPALAVGPIEFALDLDTAQRAGQGRCGPAAQMAEPIAKHATDHRAGQVPLLRWSSRGTTRVRA
jgi:hypothetical protein